MDFNISNDDNEDSFGDTLVTKPSHDDNNTDEVIKNESNDELPQHNVLKIEKMFKNLEDFWPFWRFWEINICC